MIVNLSCAICGASFNRSICKTSLGVPRYCGINCKSEAQRRSKPVTKEWLEQKYLIEKLGCPEISKLVNRNSKRVWEWIVDFGIPTRSPGAESGAKSFKPGQKSLFAGKKHTDETKKLFRDLRLKDPLRSEPSNLILLCRDCHLWIHSNENAKQDFIKPIPAERAA